MKETAAFLRRPLRRNPFSLVPPEHPRKRASAPATFRRLRPPHHLVLQRLAAARPARRGPTRQFELPPAPGGTCGPAALNDTTACVISRYRSSPAVPRRRRPRALGTAGAEDAGWFRGAESQNNIEPSAERRLSGIWHAAEPGQAARTGAPLGRRPLFLCIVEHTRDSTLQAGGHTHPLEISPSPQARIQGPISTSERAREKKGDDGQQTNPAPGPES